MSDINRTTLLGRLGADPVLRVTKTGIPVASFTMATETYIKSKNETETTWHNVVAWGNYAKRCKEELKKGMSTMIEGRAKVRKYQNEAGVTLYFHEVHADRVYFLNRMSGKQTASEISLEAGVREFENEMADDELEVETLAH